MDERMRAARRLAATGDWDGFAREAKRHGLGAYERAAVLLGAGSDPDQRWESGEEWLMAFAPCGREVCVRVALAICSAVVVRYQEERTNGTNPCPEEADDYLQPVLDGAERVLEGQPGMADVRKAERALRAQLPGIVFPDLHQAPTGDRMNRAVTALMCFSALFVNAPELIGRALQQLHQRARLLLGEEAIVYAAAGALPWVEERLGLGEGPAQS